MRPLPPRVGFRTAALTAASAAALALGVVVPAAPAGADLVTCVDPVTCLQYVPLPFQAGPQLGGEPRALTVLGDRLLFTADGEDTGAELWVSDLTDAGTAPVVDLNPGEMSGAPYGELVVLGDHAYFVGDDGVHGEELWRTDGTAAGTTMVHEARPGAASSEPRHLSVAGGRIYWQAFDGDARDLWVSDGTPAGTRKVAGTPAVPADFDGVPVPVGEHVYFEGISGGVRHLAVTDGTAAGTRLVRRFPQGVQWFRFGGFPVADHRLLAASDLVYFQANDPDDAPDHGLEVWRSDGTAEGTFELADLAAGDAFPSAVAVGWWEGDFYFHPRIGEHSFDVYRTDGTPEGTVATGDRTDDVERVLASSPEALLLERGIGLSLGEIESLDGSGLGALTLGRRSAGGDAVDEETFQSATGGVIHDSTAYVAVSTITGARTDAVYAVDLATRRTTASTLGDETVIRGGMVILDGDLVVAAGVPGEESWHLWAHPLPADPEPDPEVEVSVAIAGSAQVGRTLTADTSGTDPEADLAYQWFLDDEAVPGATRAAWRLPASALGGRVAVEVVGTRDAHTAGTARAEAAALVTPGRLAVAVRVTGRAEVGRTVRARVTGASGADVRFQWKLGSRAVRGATRASWKVTRAARGKRISVTVRVTRPGFASVVRTARHPRSVRR